MPDPHHLLAKLQAVTEKNSRYPLEAYGFVMAGLDHAVSTLAKPRHVTGRELSEALREFALDQYGPLAVSVLEHWGIRRTRDFGEMVFILVEAGLMSKTDQDSIADFEDVYDFREAFERSSVFNLDDLDLTSETDIPKGKEKTSGYGW